MKSDRTDVIQVAGETEKKFALTVVEDFEDAVVTGADEKWLSWMESARADWA